MVSQPRVVQQRLKRARAAPESQRVDRQHGDVRVDKITRIAGLLILAIQRLAHDHPQRVAGGDRVACGHHEFVGVRMLRPAVIVTESAVFRTEQVRRHIVRCVCERSAEMPGLGVISEQHQGHAGHVSNVVEQRIVCHRLLPGERRNFGNERCHGCSQKELHHNINDNLGKSGTARGTRAIASGFGIVKGSGFEFTVRFICGRGPIWPGLVFVRRSNQKDG